MFPHLTGKQADVFAFIISYFKLEQSMPTLADIAYHFNWSSLNAAKGHIDALVKRRYLSERRGKTPAYKIADVEIKLEFK